MRHSTSMSLYFRNLLAILDSEKPQSNFHHCSLQWRHNEHHGVSNHQPHGCLLNSLFRRRSKKTSKLRVSGLCEGNSPHKGPLTRKMFPSDDVIMCACVMPQLHHTPGPRTGCSWAVHELFWTKIARPRTGPVRAPCGAVRILPPRPVEF